MTEPTLDLSKTPLKLLVDICYGMSKAKGFHDTGAPFGARIDQKLMLAVGELAEAQEELRAGHAPQEIYFPTSAITKAHDDLAAEGHKPEGFPIELADAIIRIFDLAGSLGINLQGAIQTKLTYNLTRPHKHSKQY